MAEENELDPAMTLESAENAMRAGTIEILTSAIARLGWDNRFQESALDMATKLTNAIEEIQATEVVTDPV